MTLTPGGTNAAKGSYYVSLLGTGVQSTPRIIQFNVDNAGLVTAPKGMEFTFPMPSSDIAKLALKLS